MPNTGHFGLENPGVVGAQGVRGFQGFQGIQGPQGNQGNQGAIAPVAAAMYGEMSGSSLSISIAASPAYAQVTTLTAGDLSNVTVSSSQLVAGIAGPVRLQGTLSYTNPGSNNVIRIQIFKNGSGIADTIQEAKATTANAFEYVVSTSALDVAAVNDVYDLRVTDITGNTTLSVAFARLDLNMLSGTQGVQGAQGNQGNQGFQGTNPGPQGAQGPQGNQGSQGSQGPQGNQGSAGTNGTQGAQGPQGNQGNQGNQGSTGATGAAGGLGFVALGVNANDVTEGCWAPSGFTNGPVGSINNSYRVPMAAITTFRNMIIEVVANTYAGDVTVSLAKNGADTGLIVTYAAGETGQKTASGVVTFAPGDYASFRFLCPHTGIAGLNACGYAVG